MPERALAAGDPLGSLSCRTFLCDSARRLTNKGFDDAL